MTTTDTFVKMVIDRWDASVNNCDMLIDSLSDEDLNREIAPGRNRGIYLLGHLIAVHDDMVVLLDLGEKQYAELAEPFLRNPDRMITDIPSAAMLRSIWAEQCAMLNQKFSALTPAQWFEKHTAVPAQEFATEPHRNKLNIIITRTSHLQYHMGQLRLLKP